MNKMSPSVRNRVPSTQDVYSSSQWNRVNSCKKLDSPTKLSDKKRKRSQNSQYRNKMKKCDTQQNIVNEVTYLKE